MYYAKSRVYARGEGCGCPGVEVRDSITSGPKWPPCRQTLEVETRPLNAEP